MLSRYADASVSPNAFAARKSHRAEHEEFLATRRAVRAAGASVSSRAAIGIPMRKNPSGLAGPIGAW
ncbi:MAG TPA: hypothetical protein VJ774_00075, partial [Actinomycetota bacterium]|nr:hypothetical protein [Actinomycetota bacterium]